MHKLHPHPCPREMCAHLRATSCPAGKIQKSHLSLPFTRSKFPFCEVRTTRKTLRNQSLHRHSLRGISTLGVKENDAIHEYASGTCRRQGHIERVRVRDDD